MRDELLPGTLEMLILRSISLTPMHGYAIAQRVRQVSGEVLQIEEGSLYPALQRLLAKKWVKANWRETPTKRRARDYPITAAGRKQVGQDVASFERIAEAIRCVLKHA